MTVNFKVKISEFHFFASESLSFVQVFASTMEIRASNFSQMVNVPDLQFEGQTLII